MIIMPNKDKNISKNMVKWEFNEDVSRVFDEMLERSIPSYNRMRYLITEIIVKHIEKYNLESTSVLDLGCSTAEQILLLNTRLPSNNFVGVECSKPMLKEASEKSESFDNVLIKDLDIKFDDFPVTNCGAILSILTLQFIPIEYRQKIMNNIYNSLDNYGIFLFVEKIIGNNYSYSELYESLYYDMKQINGYSLDEIRDKKLKLEGVLVPCTDEFNTNLLKQAGFTKIDIFWKDLNFIGYLAMK